MFRFTIRDVLWLTVVVALAIALWIEHGNSERWRWNAAVLSAYIKQSERADVKFTAKEITLYWPEPKP